MSQCTLSIGTVINKITNGYKYMEGFYPYIRMKFMTFLGWIVFIYGDIFLVSVSCKNSTTNDEWFYGLVGKLECTSTYQQDDPT